jgi:hypothetical protein
MSKTPKPPKFQNLPTLEDLASRRGQTISSIVNDWGITTIDEIVEKLKTEGLTSTSDLSNLFAKPKQEPKPQLESPLVVLDKPVAVLEKKSTKDTEQDSKKSTKTKITYDVIDSTNTSRDPSESASMVPDKTEECKSKT